MSGPALHAGTRCAAARAALLALGLLAACSRAAATSTPPAVDSASEDLLPSSTGVPEGEAKPHRIPRRKDLPCFQCHDFGQFEKGPPFPHETEEHRSLGHCSACHESLGHKGLRFNKPACLGCHDEADLKEKIPGLPTGEKPAEPAPDAPKP